LAALEVGLDGGESLGGAGSAGLAHGGWTHGDLWTWRINERFALVDQVHEEARDQKLPNAQTYFSICACKALRLYWLTNRLGTRRNATQKSCSRNH
jgi:hypothetical protein